MLIKPKHRKIVLNLRDPTRVLTVLPTARTINYKGRTLVVVPHRIDEVKVLKNLGIAVPSPVDYYYQYPGRFPPFAHQRVTTAFLAQHNRAFCLNDLGSGKTLSGLWAYDYLRQEGAANKLLIISPLSTLERTWGDEIFKHFPHLTFAVLHGDRGKRFKLLEQDVDAYIVNHDGAKILADAVAKRDDIDTVLIDEIAQAGRNASTGKWKALRKITVGKPRVWGFTGTPIPNSPVDAWAQCRLICPERVPPYMSKFRDLVMKQVSPFKWVPRHGALQMVSDAMQPAIRFKREECIDLPPVTYETRSVELTAEQKELYRSMVDTLHSEYEGAQITAVNEAVKAMKLVQIATGVLYDNEGESVVVPAQNRLAVTEEIIRDAGSKVIVFVPFTSALESVTAYLRKAGLTAEEIQGGTSKAERDRIFGEFQHAEDPRVLVANPGTMSHGLTLTAASVIVWFAPTNSAEIYEQACARITRPGQKLNQLIVNIEGSPIERGIYERLKSKTSMQGVLLQIIKDKEE